MLCPIINCIIGCAFLFSSTADIADINPDLEMQDSITCKKQIVHEYLDRFGELKDKEDWEQISRFGEHALTICVQHGWAEEEIKIRSQLASNYFYQGNYSKSHEHASKCLKRSKEEENIRGIIKGFYKLSAVLKAHARHEHNPEKRQDLLKQAKQLAKKSIEYFDESKLPDIHLKGKALISLGSAELEDTIEGNLDIAEDSFEEALRLFARINCEDDFQRTIIRMSRILYHKQQALKAKELLENIRPSIKKKRILMHCESMLAEIQHSLGFNEEAKSLALSAKQKAEKLGAKWEMLKLESFLSSLP